MARSRTLGAFIAVAMVIAAGSVNAVPSGSTVCCLSQCFDGGTSCVPISDTICLAHCFFFCSDDGGCQNPGETGCPAGQSVVGCSGACQPTCAANTPTSTPSNTPTRTPTNTPTNTPVPIGGACSTPAQCAPPGFCVDNVCCNAPCTGPLQRCDLPDELGSCVSAAAPAPTLTPSGLLATALLLVSAGVFTLRHRMRGR